MSLVKEFLRAFERRLRHRKLRLRGLDLRLRVGVVVAELGQSRDIENHPVGAQLLLMRRGRQRGCRDTAALLRIGVDRDHRLAGLAGNANRYFDRPLALGLDCRRVAPCKEPPTHEGTERDNGCRDQQLHRPRSRRSLPLAHPEPPDYLTQARPGFPAKCPGSNLLVRPASLGVVIAEKICFVSPVCGRRDINRPTPRLDSGREADVVPGPLWVIRVGLPYLRYICFPAHLGLAKEPICVSPYLYRARNPVERFCNKIKQCRRAATRRYKVASLTTGPASSAYPFGFGYALTIALRLYRAGERAWRQAGLLIAVHAASESM